jgi:DNA-binding MarR family transcriptional regulator
MPHLSMDTTGSVQQCLGLLSRLTSAIRSIRRALGEAAKPIGLNETQALLLYFCHDAPAGRAQRELADMLGMSPAQVSGLVEQLRSRGLMEGRRPPNDRRRQVWHLTESGQAVLDQLMTSLTPWATELMAALVNDGLRGLPGDVERLAAAAAETSATVSRTARKRGAA